MTDSSVSPSATAPDQRFLAAIIVPLAAAIVGLLVAVIVGIYGLIETEDRSQVGKIVDAAQNLLRVQLEEEDETLKVGLSGVLNNPEFAAPLRAGDRARLMSLAQPFYDRMRPFGQITRFYIMDTQGATLARVHSPKSIERQSLAVTPLVPSGNAAGPVLGKLGALTLRTSAPFRDKGDTIGYVELGEEFKHITDTLHEVLGIDVLTLVDKNRLDRQAWERGQDYFHWPLPWDRLRAVVMNDSSIPALPDRIIGRLADAPHDGAVPAGYVSAEGRVYYLAPLPLVSASGDRLGSLVVVADRTSFITGSRVLMAAIALLSLIVAAALILLFHRIIRRVERRIADNIADLARANADIERIAFMACHEVQEPLDQVVTTALELERGCARLETSEAAQLRHVANAARRLEKTIGTLEDYLDLDINARQMTEVDLDATFAAALEKIRQLTGSVQVNASPLPKVMGRPVLLARALLCILDYALKSRPDEDAPPLAVWAEGKDGTWSVWFAGLPRDQAGLDPKDNVELAIARHIAHVHGGNLAIVAEPRQGGAAVLLTLRQTG